VNLVISLGSQMVTVPNVEGLTQDAAATAITGAKLTVGTVTQQSSNTAAIGNVISQDPASGSSVTEGSPVNLVISSG
jgi:beta-lactam-binding protein with PASTA domain